MKIYQQQNTLTILVDLSSLVQFYVIIMSTVLTTIMGLTDSKISITTEIFIQFIIPIVYVNKYEGSCAGMHRVQPATQLQREATEIYVKPQQILDVFKQQPCHFVQGDTMMRIEPHSMKPSLLNRKTLRISSGSGKRLNRDCMGTQKCA